MFNSILSLVLLFALPLLLNADSTSPQPLLQNPDSSKTWQLVDTFSDEFDGTRINKHKWSNNLPPWGERAWDPDNVWQENGILKIQAVYEPHKTHGKQYYYKLGILRSRQKITYGYFEARIKGCSRFPGLCPAFWLYSTNELNPDYPHITYCEIDIIEMQQNGYDMELKEKAPVNHMDCNLHTREIIDGKEVWRRPNSWPEVCKNDWLAPWDPRDDFHVYACESTPEKITWYIDGEQVAESPNHNWHLPMSLTLTMEARPPLIKWGGDAIRLVNHEAATSEGFPTHMEVDYVRCWKLAE